MTHTGDQDLRVEINNLFTPAAYEECLRRIDRMSAAAAPRWGSMTAAQMLAHCAEVQEVMNGSRALSGTPLAARLLAPLIRRLVVGEKPYPRNARTHPQYLQAGERDFERERARLLAALEAFRATEHGPPVRHALFGALSPGERGRASYKHLDHHLRQFAV